MVLGAAALVVVVLGYWLYTSAPSSYKPAIDETSKGTADPCSDSVVLHDKVDKLTDATSLINSTTLL